MGHPKPNTGSQIRKSLDRRSRLVSNRPGIDSRRSLGATFGIVAKPRWLEGRTCSGLTVAIDQNGIAADSFAITESNFESDTYTITLADSKAKFNAVRSIASAAGHHTNSVLERASLCVSWSDRDAQR
jgi:hypothetical protein